MPRFNSTLHGYCLKHRRSFRRGDVCGECRSERLMAEQVQANVERTVEDRKALARRYREMFPAEDAS